MSVWLRLMPAVLALTAGACAWCMPTLYGDTGLVSVPTAETMSPTQFELAAGFVEQGNDTADANAFPLRLTYGLADNTELFVMTTNASRSSGGGFDAKCAGLKMALGQEKVVTGNPGFAVGVRAMQDMHGYDGVEAYGVVTKTILARGENAGGYAMRVHAGAAYTSLDGATNASFISPFAGFDYKAGNGNGIIVDFVPSLSKGGVTYRKSTVSASYTYTLTEAFSVALGTTRPFGDPDSDQSVYLGLSYRYNPDASVTPY